MRLKLLPETLPVYIQLYHKVSTFKHQLKSHLFQSAFAIYKPLTASPIRLKSFGILQMCIWHVGNSYLLSPTIRSGTVMISVCAGPKGTPNSALMSGVPTTGAGPALATPSLALICDAAAAASCAALLAPLHTHTHTYIHVNWLTFNPNSSVSITEMHSTQLKIFATAQHFSQFLQLIPHQKSTA